MNATNNGAGFIPFIDQLKRLYPGDPIVPNMAGVLPQDMPKDLTGFTMSMPATAPGPIDKAIPFLGAAKSIYDATGPQGSLTKGNPIPLATDIMGMK